MLATTSHNLETNGDDGGGVIWPPVETTFDDFDGYVESGIAMLGLLKSSQSMPQDVEFARVMRTSLTADEFLSLGSHAIRQE